MQPDPNLFNSPFFYEWANVLYKNYVKIKWQETLVKCM
jgi:hypothetical protein